MMVEDPRSVRLRKWLAHGFPTVFLAMILFPFLMIVSISLRTGNFSTGSLIPSQPTLEHWYLAFGLEYTRDDGTVVPPRFPVLLWMWNSIKVGMVAATGVVFLSTIAAFGFSCLKFRGRLALLDSLLLIQMFPTTLALVAIYAIFDSLDKDFPRFGLPPYAARVPSVRDKRAIEVKVIKGATFINDIASTDLARTSLEADFHCVTTCSHVGAHRRGVSFSNFYEEYIRPRQDSNSPIVAAVLSRRTATRHPGYWKICWGGANVMLADTLDDESLTIEHGAPLRLVAPEHYGYMNLKHLPRIEFHAEVPVIKRGIRAFLHHPRARVRREARGRCIPGWILRFLYRPLVPGTVKDFHSAMQQYRHEKGQYMTRD